MKVNIDVKNAYQTVLITKKKMNEIQEMYNELNEYIKTYSIPCFLVGVSINIVPNDYEEVLISLEFKHRGTEQKVFGHTLNELKMLFFQFIASR